MALDRENEYCSKCGDPTGRAGNYEDSLFIDEEGPLCDDCYWTITDTSPGFSLDQ